MQTKWLSACAAAAWLTVAVSAQSPADQAPTAGQHPSQTQGQNVTVTGCVAAGPNNTFTLTAAAPQNEAPLGTTATTPTGGKVEKTITYALNGANAADFKPHVGHTVQVTGVESAPQATAQVTEKSTAPAATGTSGTGAGSTKSTVETTAQAQIVMRQLAVSSVKMVSNSCTLLK